MKSSSRSVGYIGSAICGRRHAVARHFTVAQRSFASIRSCACPSCTRTVITGWPHRVNIGRALLSAGRIRLGEHLEGRKGRQTHDCGQTYAAKSNRTHRSTRDENGHIRPPSTEVRRRATICRYDVQHLGPGSRGRRGRNVLRCGRNCERRPKVPREEVADPLTETLRSPSSHRGCGVCDRMKETPRRTYWQPSSNRRGRRNTDTTGCRGRRVLRR